MAVDRFDFSCVLTLPDGIVAEMYQTEIQRDERQGMMFFIKVRPHAAELKPFVGVLHLSGRSLANLSACAGDTGRVEESQRVVRALQARVRQHGLEMPFALEVSVGSVNGDPCHVTIAAR